jgi:transglutaminase-like putative cysteine protease
MRLEPLYRASMYVMLTLATLVLSINATDYNRFAMLFPLGVALAGVAAFVTVDRHPKQGLARDLANFLALGSFLVAMAEYQGESTALPLALGHWLVYLQLVKMFLPKTIEDDWFLFLVGLVQVVIGVVLSQSTEVGGLLMLWALVSLWTLGLFHLQREARRSQPAEGVSVLPPPHRENPYPGLFNFGFVLSGLLVALTTLALGGIVFLMIPRWGSASTTPTASRPARNLTGFSEEVELGRMGEILENDAVVMTIELLDGRDRRVRPDPDLLWRGVTMARYGLGRWSRQGGRTIAVERARFPVLDDEQMLKQRIQLEPTQTNALFALRPIYGVRARGTDLLMNIRDGTVFRGDTEAGAGGGEPTPVTTLRYEVLTSRTGGPQPDEAYPTNHATSRQITRKLLGPLNTLMPLPDVDIELLEVPEDIAPRLGELALEVLGDDREAPSTRRARKLESHFRDSGLYYYSLRMSQVDPIVDPVLDFLVNRREGHCEYFASALALILRTQGIPTRVVNGFKGGDYDNIFGALTVREKHAHSWVEALVGVDSEGRPEWITLDPTPALERQKVVEQVGVPGQVRGVTDHFRNFWLFYVAGFDQERQQRLIYRPLRELAQESAKGFRLIFEALRRALAWLFHFERPYEFFSVRGFVVSVVVMLLAVAGFAVLRWLVGRVLRRLRGEVQGEDGLGSGLAAYHRMIRLLAEAGLERPESETPREFARRAASALAARAEEAAALSELPTAIVEAFYRVRFGHHALDPEMVRDLDARLDSLAARLHASRS